MHISTVQIGSHILAHYSMSGPGVVVSSIDNLPSQLPLESTNMFGAMLLPYVKEFVSEYNYLISKN